MFPNPIVVSDEEIKEGDWCYYPKNKKPFKVSTYIVQDWLKKIIAGIPELPAIDFSALSEKDCKRIGWIDVEKIADEKFPEDGMHNHRYWQSLGFVEGYHYAQSLNEKKYSEKDMLLAYKEGSYNRVHKGFKEFIQSLSQPKVFDCLVEMGSMRLNSDGEEIGFPDMTQPKITNNSIKILKVL